MASREEIAKQVTQVRTALKVSTYQLEKAGIRPSNKGAIEDLKAGYSIDTLIKYLNAIDQNISIKIERDVTKFKPSISCKYIVTLENDEQSLLIIDKKTTLAKELQKLGKLMEQIKTIEKVK